MIGYWWGRETCVLNTIRTKMLESTLCNNFAKKPQKMYGVCKISFDTPKKLKTVSFTTAWLFPHTLKTKDSKFNEVLPFLKEHFSITRYVFSTLINIYDRVFLRSYLTAFRY